MEVNVNFRNDLEVEYLALLANIENVKEFERFYPSIENYLVSLVENSSDTTLLGKVNEILAFRKKCLGKQL